MANETVKDRLISFIRFKGLSKNKFEELCGLSKRYVSNISVSIQPDKIKKISFVFPELNTGWLLSGEGQMLKEGVYVPDVLLEQDHAAPLKRILQLLTEEGITLKEFTQLVNSNEIQFNRAMSWPWQSSNPILGNDPKIRDWVNAFCELFPHYSKLWILSGKKEKLTYVAKGIDEIKERIKNQQDEERETILRLLNLLIKEKQ